MQSNDGVGNECYLFISRNGILATERKSGIKYWLLTYVTVYAETNHMSAKCILCKWLNTALWERFHENRFISFLGSIGIIEPTYQVSATAVTHAWRNSGKNSAMSGVCGRGMREYGEIIRRRVL